MSESENRSGNNENDRGNEIGYRLFSSDLLFIRVLIIREGAAPLPFLLNNFNIRVNTRRDISSGNTLIASREVGRIG